MIGTRPLLHIKTQDKRALKIKDQGLTGQTLLLIDPKFKTYQAATTDIGLEAGQGSGTMHKTPTRPHDFALLRVHTLGSDKGSLQQNELIDLVTKLTDRVEVLENDLQ
ncbi:hypothetical protein Tco_1115866 [Tanacetum coccineum]